MNYNEELELFKQLARQSEDLFFIFDVQKNLIEFANAAFKKILKQEFVSVKHNPSTLYQLIHPEDLDFVKLNLKEVLEKKRSARLDFRIIWPDQTERWITIKIYPIIVDQQVRYIGGLLEDDSARKKAMLNMEKITAWKNTTLEVIAHDLRGPIGNVKMLTAVIEGMLPIEKFATIHQITNTIVTICSRNIDMIANLIKKEDLDTESTAISLERIDVVWEIEQVLKVYFQTQDYTGKEIQFTKSHPDVYAMVDSAKFLQIVNNLLSNALKFTSKGGLIKVHVEQLESSFLLSVKDNGIGIPVMLQPYLFMKYTNAKRVGLNGEEPIGLGMWIIASIVKQHEGIIWFETEEKKGSTFYVEIPLKKFIKNNEYSEG